MGQKMDPHGLRVGVIKDWSSKWYADSKNFGEYLVEDNKIRKYIKKKLYVSGISKIEIERTAKFVKVNVYTAKPGLVIGKGGNLAETLKNELQKMINKDVNLNIVEVKNADMDAQLVAENIAGQLERRISFRRAMKQCMQKTMKSGALGIKTSVSGRLGGADMARTEFYKDGTIPLQTLRADIDYGFAEADTTYGKIGVKVWIYKGRTKYRKLQKGRMRGKATRGNKVTDGEFGLQAVDAALITSNQIEAARIAMTRYTKRGGKVWIKIFPDKPITNKGIGTRMGKGKGAVTYWVAVVKPGRVMFEIAGVSEDVAKEALRLAANKLSVKCKFVKKETEIGGDVDEDK